MKKLFWKFKTIGLLKSGLQNKMKKIITIKKKIGFLPKRKNQRKWWGGSELKLRGKNSKKSDELARSRGGWGSSYFRRAENLEWRMEKDACWGGWKGIWRGAWEGVQVEPLTLTDMVRNILLFHLAPSPSWFPPNFQNPTKWNLIQWHYYN